MRDLKSCKTRTVLTHHVVNSAGLYAQDVARSLGVPHNAVPKQYLAKGNYFTLKGDLHPRLQWLQSLALIMTQSTTSVSSRQQGGTIVSPTFLR